MTLREEFEAWFNVDTGDQSDDPMQTAWEAWQAAYLSGQRSMLEAEPVAWELRAGKTDRVLLEITNNAERAQDWRASLMIVVPLYRLKEDAKP
jgi:hypothetical protein